MKFELDLARKIHEKHGIPISEKPLQKIERDAGAKMRKAVRMETDGLIHGGLIGGGMEEVAAGLGGTMTATAGVLLQLGAQPGNADLISAAKELIEDARVLIDNGVAFSELDQVKVGAVALHIVCLGIAAALAIPYGRVLQACAACYVEGKPADREALQALIGAARVDAQQRPESPNAAPSGKPVRVKKPRVAKPGVAAAQNGALCPICQGNMPCGEVGHPGNTRYNGT